MSLKVGIVGLPNVGKSTLFNALTQSAFAQGSGGQGKLAEAKNYPFTTIEPNVGIVPVPDVRLDALAKISASEKITPTTIEFVDIAGLVKDAHAGEGLGNKFLSHIREVDAIAHVVRFFDNTDIIHVDNAVDPLRDAATIETELALADLEAVERALARAEHNAKGNDKTAKAELPTWQKLRDALAAGQQARDLTVTTEEQKIMAQLPLLTNKPTLYVANVSEVQLTNAAAVTQHFSEKYQPVLALSVKIEQELVEISEEERAAFLAEYHLDATGLTRLIQASYELLGLITFLTSGPTETRAWTVQRGRAAPQAAGKIHSDMERGFIRAETVSYAHLTSAGSYAAARAKGQVRDEGKEYVVQDGDVMLFKFSV